MKTYISINIISETLITLSSIKKNDCYNYSDIISLHLPYGVRYDVSLDFAKQCAWMTERNGYYIITSSGDEIITRFNGTNIDAELWKIILKNYIVACKPAWARRIPYGRKEAFLFMSEEEKQCFVEAGLIDSFDLNVINWWDSFAEEERIKADKYKECVGREGEQRTILYEEKRTGCKPEWHSIESNLSGYDIISVNSQGNKSKLLIEVKASSNEIDNASAFISRNEWNVASLLNNRGRYFFYFWLLSRTGPCSLAIISADEMEKHIPDDKEYGKWEVTSIPFSAFKNKFVTVI